MSEIIPYHVHRLHEWDSFVNTSKNGTFIHKRAFMEYHEDRFVDSSFMIYEDEQLMGLFPANSVGDSLYSHQGLTYGGIILQRNAGLSSVVKWFGELIHQLKIYFHDVLIKSIPAFYYDPSSFEESYALYHYNAQLVRRDTYFVIDLNRELCFKKRRLRGIRKGSKYGVKMEKSTNFKPFWNDVLIPNLKKKYNVNPLHSVKEIEELHQKFPEHIELQCAYLGDELVAGICMFLTKTTMHAQYIASTKLGRDIGALDFLIDQLINQKSNRRYFSLGITNEKNNLEMNWGLVEWKEGFDSYVCPQDFYHIKF